MDLDEVDRLLKFKYRKERESFDFLKKSYGINGFLETEENVKQKKNQNWKRSKKNKKYRR